MRKDPIAVKGVTSVVNIASYRLFYIINKMDREFGGVIWTDHALDRLKERGIKQGDAWATWKNPDQSRYAKSRGAWIYYKTYGNEKIEVVAKKNEKRKWIILSVWSKAVYKKQKKKDSLLELIFNRLFKKN